jgi:hypothetical protein
MKSTSVGSNIGPSDRGRSGEAICAGGRTGEKTVMSVEQVKDEIRRLRRSEKIEIYRWLDNSVGADFSSRIGADRSLEIRHAIDQICKVIIR